MSNSCFYCGQEFALPHQRMVHEERCGGGGGSEKDAMFRYSEPMELAYRLLKVDDDDDGDDEMPPEVMEGLLDFLMRIGAVEDDAQPEESKDEQMERHRQMELGLHPRPYANITTEELEGNLLWMIKPEHAEERAQVMDELNLRGHTSIDMQPNTDNNMQAMSRVFSETGEYPDFGVQTADERMEWQDKMKGEPMDIAWQLLKDD